MTWWMYIVVVALLAAGVYGFAVLVGFHTRRLTSKTDLRAEDLYDRFADPLRKRRPRS
jgi:hypothetical protein